MSIFFLIILGYILYLILRPIWKVWSISRRFRKGDYTVFGDIFGQPGAQKSTSAYDGYGRRKAGWTNPAAKRKKIGKDVGEYVKFKEVTVTEEQQERQNREPQTSFTREEQISDIEWEEIR